MIRGDNVRFVMLEITDDSLSDQEAIGMVETALSEHQFGIQFSDDKHRLIEIYYRPYKSGVREWESPEISRIVK